MNDSAQSFQVSSRGPTPAVRLVFFVVLSLLLMFVDTRFHYLESTRSVVSVLISPLQRMAGLPAVIFEQGAEFFVTQGRLIAENKELRRQHERDAAQLLPALAIQQENQQLRAMQELQQRENLRGSFAEIVYAAHDVFSMKLLINKGASDRIRPGQVVMDEQGVIGQITRVYPWLSEVTLVTEKDHAVPVQIQRNGVRTVVFGAGDTSQLVIRYMPVSTDIQNGDILVTSGIDGIYPQGIPVAKVIKIERNAGYPFARIICMPLGGVDRHRHMLVLAPLAQQPARPAADDPGVTVPEDKVEVQ
ncbi:MAG: rod shape-determining protein MreC [Gallionella sp.]|nr:rod shape-determining protein MreC [Gallionella sp.]MDD4945486.1 rod shape-determining protein MreC [Gallionella sp.]MDD5612309.1 rod shape-determining protein MreC [Gallionella sp.]